MRCGLAVALSLLPCASAAQEAKLLSVYEWTSPHEDFGGISGFDYHDNGSRFSAVTDRGRLIEGSVERSGHDIVSVDTANPIPLRIRANQVIKQKGPDAEGVAIGSTAQRYISFEGVHRIRKVAAADRIEDLAPLAPFGPFELNGSFEALAIDAGGTLFTLPERSGRINSAFDVFRLSSDQWETFGTIQRRHGFLPVGADFGPDDRFYLLERAFLGPGFRSRIRSFENGPSGFIDERVHLTTSIGTHGNLEAIAVWQSPDGLRATLVSDDNFVRFQTTEIVEYLLH